MVNPLSGPTSDDKLWAGLSYVGIIFFMLGPIVIFFMKREESAFIKFHALQALGYGLAWFVLSMGLMIGSMVMGMIPVIGLIFGLVAGLVVPLALVGYWIYLFIQAFQGKDVRIPLLSDFIDKNLMA